jgi:hypothetical protein
MLSRVLCSSPAIGPRFLRVLNHMATFHLVPRHVPCHWLRFKLDLDTNHLEFHRNVVHVTQIDDSDKRLSSFQRMQRQDYESYAVI